MIFIDPDELSKNSRFPKSIKSKPLPALEATLGADFVVSPIPISPLDNLPALIKAGSYFVQRKSAWDIQSFDNLKRSIARMRKAGIPQRKCVLLLIGSYEAGIDGSLTINNQVSNQAISYEVFTELKALWTERGGVVDQIPKENYLTYWIEGRLLALKNISKSDKKILYPDKTDYILQDESGLQIIEEVPADDLRSLLCRGLPNFGPKSCEAVVKVLNEGQFELNLFNALWILTTTNESGNPLYKIPGIGPKKINQIKSLLFSDANDWQLGIRFNRHDNNQHDKFIHGWQSAIEEVAKTISEAGAGKVNIAAILKKVNQQGLDWSRK